MGRDGVVQAGFSRLCADSLRVSKASLCVRLFTTESAQHKVILAQGHFRLNSNDVGLCLRNWGTAGVWLQGA